jgi:hypothetical protein
MRSHEITVTSAPILNTVPASSLSPSYSLVPTATILSALRDCGWEWSSGTARSTKNSATAAHVVRLRHPELPQIRGNVLEALLMNSHDGTTAFRMELGIFRFACANGLVVSTATAGTVRLIHSRLSIDNVVEAARKMIAEAPKAADAIDRWSTITVDDPTARQMARRCAIERWGHRLADLDTDRMVRSRREEDGDCDLWTTFNRVQESVVRGGFRVGLRPEGDLTNDRVSYRKAVPMRGALRQVALNRSLWDVGSEYAVSLSA